MSTTPNLTGFHHLELWVADAWKTARLWQDQLGFEISDEREYQSGNVRTVELRQGDIAVFVTEAANGSKAAHIAEHVARHGDSVRDVSFGVKSSRDLDAPSLSGTLQNEEGGDGSTKVMPVYGDTVHSFTVDEETRNRTHPTRLLTIDHVNAVVPAGFTDHWVKVYSHALGFEQTQQFDPSSLATQDSAVMTRVIGDGLRIKLPFSEPAPGRPGHVGRFLDANNGAGVQHIALETRDIFSAVDDLSARGLEFMRTKPGYFEERRPLAEKFGLAIDDLARLNILLDSDDEGYLLQIFTLPVVDRPTLFLELIQREGSTGFGAANIRWLAKSAEDAIG